MKRILIIEDRRPLAEELGRRLDGHPCGERAVAVHARSIFDGLRLASLRGPFDLSVLGLMMPVPATLGLVREMRALLPGAPVAVLARVPDPAGSIGDEADAWIVKDAPIQEIVDRLGGLLARGDRASV